MFIKFDDVSSRMFIKFDDVKSQYIKYVKASDIQAIRISYWDGYRIVADTGANCYIWKQFGSSESYEDVQKEAEDFVHLVEKMCQEENE